MPTPIDIRADHLRIVRDVLARHLPDGVRVWVFGSRATWATKDSSDLDLALEGDGEISKRAFRPLPVVVPANRVLDVYDRASRALYNRIVSNTKESALLVALRDVLLSKVVCGEIRVHDLEEFTGSSEHASPTEGVGNHQL